MGYVSVENTDRLFWLGRYSERVYTTIKLFSESYDKLIDGSEDGYKSFCLSLEIPDIYKDREDFILRYSMDKSNPDSIYSNLIRAFDNAILLREEITSDALAYIQLALGEMKKASNSTSPLMELQGVMDNILAFWGITDDIIEDENIRNLIKCGKRIERLDLYSRLHKDQKSMLREIHRLKVRLTRTSIAYDPDTVQEVEALIEKSPINYYAVLQKTEAIVS